MVEWTNNTPFSTANLAKSTILVIDGSGVGAANKYTGMLISITADGGGFNNETVVLKTATGYKLLTMIAHTHDADDDESGGTLKDIFQLNHDALYIDRRNSTVNDWISEGSGGSTTDNSNGATRLTATTTNNWRGIRVRGVPPDYAYYIRAQYMLEYTGAVTNNIVRCGCDMENLGVANNNNKKFGIEGCESTGSTWQIVSANGSSRTQTDSGVDLVQSSQDSYSVENNPGTNIRLSFNGGSFINKTTTLPGSGAPDRANVAMAGVKSTNTSGKSLDVYGMLLTGKASTTGWKH